MSLKIKIFEIIGILIFHIIFVNLNYIKNYTYITFILSIIVLFFLAFKIKYFINKKYLKINVLILTLLISIIISSLLSEWNSYRGILFGIKVLEIFLFLEYIYQINKKDEIIKLFFKLSLFYCVVNDLVMFAIPSLYTINGSNYLLGNKFHVSYLHLLSLVFYMCLPNFKKKYISIIYFFSVFISIFVNCNTALIGYILFVIVYLIGKKVNLYNSRIFIFVLLISTSLLFVSREILNVKIVQYFIVNVLNEDLTLTGRLTIYDNDIEIISKKIWTGYGYGNSYDVMHDAIGAPNTQNALLECLLNFGVIGTTFLLLIICCILNNSDNKQKLYPIVIYLYVFAILGMVETTININYIALVAMLNVNYILMEGEKNARKQN